MPKIDKFKSFSVNIPSDGKYKIGTVSHKVAEVATKRPKFAFDYISLRNGLFCFNSNYLGLRHYLNLVKGLKDASQYTYKELEDSQTFHFHDIDFDDVTIRKSDFYKAIINNYEDEDYIIPYQLKVFKEERVIGFLYEGTFYLVMFDVGHNAYSRSDSKKKRRKKK